ncbi:unnamed protein product [Gordionus sp. m RMFG-2023]
MNSYDRTLSYGLSIKLILFNLDAAPFLLRVFALDHPSCTTEPIFSYIIQWLKKFVMSKESNHNASLYSYSPIKPNKALDTHNDAHRKFSTNGHLIVENSTETNKNENSSQLPPSDKSYYPTLILCFLGLQGVFLTWGIVQEKIITKPYRRILDIDAEALDSPIMDKFTDSQFLVFTNKLAGFILAGLWLSSRSYIFNIFKSIFYRRPSKYYDPYPKYDFNIHSLNNNICDNLILKPALYRYSYASLSNILSSWCQYEALKYVSFPTQVLFKSGKIIPVMIMSKLMSNQKKHYAWHEYFCAGLVSIGIGAFLISRSHSKKNSSLSPDLDIWKWVSGLSDISISTLSGILLLIGYVMFDSFTSNWQAQLFERYNSKPINQSNKKKSFYKEVTSIKDDASKESFHKISYDNERMESLEDFKENSKLLGEPEILPKRVTKSCIKGASLSSWDMMCYVNFFSTIFTGLSLVLRDLKIGHGDGLMQSIFFARTHEISFLRDLAALSLCSALGQIFIFMTISKFGAVTFITTMTIRQGFAVLLSCLIYGHRVGPLGILGIMLVFSSLFAKIYISSRLKNINRNKGGISSLKELESQNNLEFKHLHLSSRLFRWFTNLHVFNKNKIRKRLFL